MVTFDPGSFITIFDGLLKSGKTFQALRLGEQSGLPVVVVVPGPKTANEELRAIPYVIFSKLKGMKKSLGDLARENGRLRVVLDRSVEGDLDLVTIFQTLNFPSFQIWDDFPSLLVEAGEKRRFGVWTTLVRHNKIFLCLTTQRVMGEIPRLARTIVGQIYVVGPMGLQEETRDLYGQTNLPNIESWEQFHEILKKNAPRNPLLIRG